MACGSASDPNSKVELAGAAYAHDAGHQTSSVEDLNAGQNIGIAKDESFCDLTASEAQEVRLLTLSPYPNRDDSHFLPFDLMFHMLGHYVEAACKEDMNRHG
jgi:hypothetical protein